MVQVYKIPKRIDRLESNQFFSLADISNTRGHSLKVVKRRSKCIQSESNKRLERVTQQTSRLDKHWFSECYNLPLFIK